LSSLYGLKVKIGAIKGKGRLGSFRAEVRDELTWVEGRDGLAEAESQCWPIWLKVETSLFRLKIKTN